MAVILVVDDTTLILNMMRDLLQRRGYQALTAGAGLQALEIATKHPHPVDLLITDVQMPGISGPQLVEQFTPHFPLAKVLYISGEEPPPTICEQVAQGRATFLRKSGDLLLFAATVEQILGSSPSEGMIAERGNPRQEPMTEKDRRSGRERRLGYDRRCNVIQWMGEDRRRRHERRQGARRAGHKVSTH
jgi:DNA-binding NtrC family response regulator